MPKYLHISKKSIIFASEIIKKTILEPAATDKRHNKMETYNIIEIDINGNERVMFTATGRCTGGITEALKALMKANPTKDYYAEQIS